MCYCLYVVCVCVFIVCCACCYVLLSVLFIVCIACLLFVIFVSLLRILVQLGDALLQLEALLPLGRQLDRQDLHMYV